MNMAKLRQILEFRRATKMPPLLPPKRSKNNDETGQEIAEAILSCTLRPKTHAIILQFAANNLYKKGINATTQIFFEIYRLPTDGGCEDNNEFEGRNNIEDELNANTSNGQRKISISGSPTEINFIRAYNPSFLEYIFAGSFLNLAFAVDFSRSDSAVDENNLRRYVSDVELSISAFGEPLREFQSSNSYAAFGLGAKIPPQFRESQEFCLNLETDPYCRGLSSVFSAFKTSFVNVQPLNMAHLSHVIYYVAKLAQNSLSRASPALSSGMETITDYNAPNYFVLVIITRGVFDDLKETVQAIIFASRSPISIIFVEICNDQKREEITELERLATAGTRLNYHGRKPERDCTQYVSIASCRFEESKPNDLKALIAERGLSTIGQQMCTWMLRNGYQKVPPTVDMQMLDPILTDIPVRIFFTVPVRKSTINAVKRQFRRLELNNFPLSLPSSPRHLNNLTLNGTSLSTAMRQHLSVDSRSSSVKSPGRRIKKATTLIQFEKNNK
uniref:Copine C-terminal domain-containing protein n=1 Tax=Meloidogyne javanica TaxID=6303 RepID=A0A915M854_MELJA